MSDEDKPHDFPEANGPDENLANLGSRIGKILLIPSVVAGMKLAKVASPINILAAVFVLDYYLREEAELQGIHAGEGKKAPNPLDVIGYIVSQPAGEVAEAFGKITDAFNDVDWDKNKDGKVAPEEFSAAIEQIAKDVAEAFSIQTPELKDMYRDVAESAVMTVLGYASVEALGHGAAAVNTQLNPHGVIVGGVAGVATSAAIGEKEKRGIYIVDMLRKIFTGGSDGDDGPGNAAGGPTAGFSRPSTQPGKGGPGRFDELTAMAPVSPNLKTRATAAGGSLWRGYQPGGMQA